MCLLRQGQNNKSDIDLHKYAHSYATQNQAHQAHTHTHRNTHVYYEQTVLPKWAKTLLLRCVFIFPEIISTQTILLLAEKQVSDMICVQYKIYIYISLESRPCFLVTWSMLKWPNGCCLFSLYEVWYLVLRVRHPDRIKEYIYGWKVASASLKAFWRSSH